VNAPPADLVSYDDIAQALTEAFAEQGEEIMMTIADTLIERGKQQGMQQGMQKGMIQTAYENVLEILEIRFGIVSQSTRHRIQRIEDAAVLKTLHRKAITVQSLDDFTQAVEKILT